MQDLKQTYINRLTTFIESTSYVPQMYYILFPLRNVDFLDDFIIQGLVKENDKKKHQVNLDLSGSLLATYNCTCDHESSEYCVHVITLAVKLKELLEQNKLHPKSILPAIETNTEITFIQNDPYLTLPSINWQQFHSEIKNKLTPNKPNNSYYQLPYVESGNLHSKKVAVSLFFEYERFKLEIIENEEGLNFYCSCIKNQQYKQIKSKITICKHLTEIIKPTYEMLFQMSFDLEKRRNHFEKKALDIKIKNVLELDLDKLFGLEIERNRILTKQLINIVSKDDPDLVSTSNRILQKSPLPWEVKDPETKPILIISKSNYNKRLYFELHRANIAKNQSLKSPIVALNNYELSQLPIKIEDYEFISALNAWNSDSDIPQVHEVMRKLLQNPMNVPFFLLDDNHGKITPTKLVSKTIHQVDVHAEILVEEQTEFFQITAKFRFDNRYISSQSIKLLDHCIIRYEQQWYFWNSSAALNLLTYFQKNEHKIFVLKNEFEGYKTVFLSDLEGQISVNYNFVKGAKKVVTSKNNYQDTSIEKRLYLTDEEDYVLLTPAISYGEKEIPLRSKTNLMLELPNGTFEERQRNEWVERGFERVLNELHPYFPQQTDQNFVYLHRNEFLENGWFLDAFEKLRGENIIILGFAQLNKNKYSPHKMSSNTSIVSGIDWFDVHSNIKFGSQEVRLQDLQKAILKRNNFVVLGDGTHGLLPDSWLSKFGSFFRSAEIKAGQMRVHKSNFQLIDDAFKDEFIDFEVKQELHNLKDKLDSFKQISQTIIPKKLKATLRNYQKEGLNWLNFLDDFGFGGCLADDMGLGKTIQIIAYILQQKEKGNKNADLVVMPTSLLFNWKSELQKFAPHLKVHELAGPKRNTSNTKFDAFDIIITTYGTLLADIEHLRKYTFNLLILDESQAIKNPQSKRYKAARLLEGRQRIVLTGTPIENNTFDLYAQLSFAMPGLLGTANQFSELYSTPIDKYGDSKRAQELRKKVNPFILRRTKKQVAKELPEKTEMVLFCEMGVNQRKLYDVFKKEFQVMLNSKEKDEIGKNSALILQGMIKLRQVCNASALLGEKADFGHESAKIAVLIEEIEEKKEQHKILIFSQFVGMLDLIRPELDKRKIKHCYLTGQTSNRQAQVDQFQNDEDTRVFLISLKAGGTGLNLTQADYVYIVDPWWNPAVENQAIDRAYRIGQEKHVVAIRLITPDSIEEKIMTLQDKKRGLADELIQIDSGAMKNLTKEDLLSLL